MHHRCTLAGLPASMAFRWRKSPCRPSLIQKNTALYGHVVQICGKSKKSEQARAGAWGRGRGRGRDCGNARQDGRGAGAHPPARGAEAPAGCVLSSRIEQKGPLLSEHRQPGRGAGTRGEGGGGYVAWPGAGRTPRSRPRWRLNGFRCSPGTPGGRKTRFGAVLAGPLAAKRVSVQSGRSRAKLWCMSRPSGPGNRRRES